MFIVQSFLSFVIDLSGSIDEMSHTEPSLSVIIRTADDKEIIWDYDKVLSAFPEIVHCKENQFDGYKGVLKLDLNVDSLILNYLAELLMPEKPRKDVNFHAIDVCLRDLSDRPEWRRVVIRLISMCIECISYRNCISLWRLCKKFKLEAREELERYITYNMIEHISNQSIDFYRLSIDEFTYFISSDFLHVKDEDDVVHLIDLYIKGNEQQRNVLYPQFYYCVRTRFIKNIMDRPLLLSHGNGQLPERAHRDIFVVIGGSVLGSYTSIPSYLIHESRQWRDIRRMQLPNNLVYHASTVLSGVLYVIGGGDGIEGYSNKVWKYDDGKWIRCADMNEKRANMNNMVVCLDGKIYVMGGNCHFITRLSSVECYDPIMDEWTMLPDMTHSRADGAACVVNGNIYVSGGLTTNRVLSEVDIYIPKEREWRGAGHLPRGISGHCMTCTDGRTLTVYGGFNGKERLSTVLKRKLPDGKWEEQISMNTPRSSASIITYGRDEVIVFGGNNQRGDYIERWNGKTWDSVETHCSREGATVSLIPDFYHEVLRSFDY